MVRLSVAVTFVFALALPGAAHAQTALSPVDQERTVCVPKRDGTGNKIGGEICMTGGQWQRALAKVPAHGKTRVAAKSVRSNIGQLAYPRYFRANPWGPLPGKAW